MTDLDKTAKRVKIARVCGREDLPEWVNRNYLSENGNGSEWANYIVIEDGDYRAFYSDAMEGEDATFSRDLGWIVGEINRAKNGGIK